MAVRWTWSLFCLLALTGCDSPEVASSPPFVVPSLSLPSWTGGFDVGRLVETWTDSARRRPLLVSIYYPAVVTDSVPMPILGDSIWSILHRDELARKLGPAAASGLAALRTRARSGAPLAPWDERFPVLLFAPSAGWLPGDYSALLEGLASHGFVVIAVAAPGEAGVMRLPDGEIVRPRLTDNGTIERLADDIAFLHARVAILNGALSSPFHDRITFYAVGALGHGVGGAAAVLAAARDTNLTAVANLDGDLLPGGDAAVVGQPMLYVTTEPAALSRMPMDRWGEDRSERRRGEQWAEWSAGSRRPERVRLAGMHQWNFLDAALVPAGAMAPDRRRPRFGEIDGARGLAIAVDVTAQFFREAFAINHRGMDEVRSLYPEVSFSR